MTTPVTAPVPPVSADPPHTHASRCFWDLHQARWSCPAPSGREDLPAPR